MKKQLPGFLAGVLTTALVCALVIPALAETGAVGTVEFNAVGLVQNGAQVFYPDEDYLLGNGYPVPGSILFTDPSGNSTTYLPVRRVAELFGSEIGWDGETESVVLGAAQADQPAPPASVPPEPAPSETAQSAPYTVYLTATGEKYHRAGCRYLKNSARATTLTEAQSGGYTPCSVCKP